VSVFLIENLDLLKDTGFFVVLFGDPLKFPPYVAGLEKSILKLSYFFDGLNLLAGLPPGDRLCFIFTGELASSKNSIHLLFLKSNKCISSSSLVTSYIPPNTNIISL